MDEAIAKIKQMLLENEEVKAKLDDLVHIKNFSDFLKSFSLIWFLLKRIVLCVEIVQKEYSMLTESERLDAAAQVLDDLITFKGWFAWLEAFDKTIFRVALSAAVQGLNDLFGNKWINSIENVMKTLNFNINLLSGDN